MYRSGRKGLLPYFLLLVSVFVDILVTEELLLVLKLSKVILVLVCPAVHFNVNVT